jgi:hypothetical protein
MVSLELESWIIESTMTETPDAHLIDDNPDVQYKQPGVIWICTRYILLAS